MNPFNGVADLNNLNDDQKQAFRTAIQEVHDEGLLSKQRRRQVKAFELSYLEGMTFENIRFVKEMASYRTAEPVTRQRIEQIRKAGEKTLRALFAQRERAA